MTRVRVRDWALPILCSLLLGSMAGATTLLRADLAELTRTSPLVVRGTVQRVDSHWAGDHRHIVTEVDISVSEALKGQPGASVHVVQPGGQVGDIAQMVSGLAAFTPGEEVVVFLQPRSGAASFLVSGMAQGKYTVQQTSGGLRMAIPASTGDALLVDPMTRAPTQASSPALRLEELRTAVRAAAGGKAPVRAP